MGAGGGRPGRDAERSRPERGDAGTCSRKMVRATSHQPRRWLPRTGSTHEMGRNKEILTEGNEGNEDQGEPSGPYAFVRFVAFCE